MSPSLSAWAVQAVGELPTLETIALTKKMDFNLEIRLGKDGLFTVYHWSNGIKTAFATFFSAVSDLTQSEIKLEKIKTITLFSLEATYVVQILVPTAGDPLLRWTATIVIGKQQSYNFTATIANGEQLKIVSICGKRQDFQINGNQNFIIKWSKSK